MYSKNNELSGSLAGPSDMLVPHRSSGFAPVPLFAHEGGLPSAAHPAVPSAQFSLSMMLQRKWTVLITFCLVAVTVVPMIWYLAVPKYRASAVVRVAPVVQRVLYMTEDNGMVPLYQSFLNTQVASIQSPRVLERVLDDPEVQKTRWYSAPPSGWLRQPLPPLQRLNEELSVGPRHGTELIDVAMTARSPQDAKLVADKVVQEYLTVVQHADAESDSFRLQALTDKQAQLRQEIDAKQRTKGALARRIGTESMDGVRSQMATSLSELNDQRDAVERFRELNEWRLATLVEERDRAKGDAREGAEEAPSDAAAVRFRQDPEWQKLSRELEEARYQLAVAQDQFGEGHPTMRRLLARVELAQERLGERETLLNDPRSAPATSPARMVDPDDTAFANVYDMRSLERAIAESQQHQKLLIEDIDAKRADVEEASDTALALATLDQEIEQTQDELDSVNERLKALRMEGKASKTLGRITQVASAILPVKPYRDRRIVLTILAFGGALAAGVGLAFLRTAMDPSMRKVGDVTATVQIPFLGHLPKVRFESELVDDSSPMLQESMRMVRTALLDRVNGQGSSAIVVTSPGARAGKTSVAILLAKSLANVGKRVLLVDGDLRRANLTERLSLGGAAGLTDVLSGRATLEKSRASDRLPSVHVLPAGSEAQRDEAELLANGAFRKCVNEWKKTYDFIIMDSPPVLPVADARILASQVDGVILTLRAAHCRRVDAIDALHQLNAAGGRTLGTVLVGADRELDYQREYGSEYDNNTRAYART